MDVYTVGIIAFAILFGLMFLGVPIAFSFLIAGITGVVMTRGLSTGLSLLGAGIYSWASVEAFVTLALFVLMGFFAFRSGISGELYDAARKYIGKYPGGLGMATILACTGFAACTGSSVAGAAAMGSIAFPEMNANNYSKRLSTGCIAAGGTLGILIPPSTAFILYGFLTETSIDRLFIAGIIPGVMLSALFLIQIFGQCKMNPLLGPPGPSFSWKEKLVSLKGAVGMIALILFVIGSLYKGICTPSEAGAIGAMGAFIIALVKRKMTVRDIITASRDTVRITCYVVLIAVGAMAMNTFLATSGFSSMFSQWVSAIPVSRYVILLAIFFMYIPLGMLMDTLGMTMLTIPIVFPIITALGFDRIWFGVVFVILTEMALISPPVAMNIYVVQGVTKVPFGDIARGVWPFIASMIACIILLIFFPQAATFLPNMMR